MKRNAVAGVIAAVTIAVGAGAGVAGYTIAHNSHKTAQAAQTVQDHTVEKTAAAEKAAAEQKAEAVKADLAAQKKAAAQAEKDRQAAENEVLAIKLGQRMKADAQQRAAEKAAAEKAAAEKAAAEKVAAEKAAAEKAAAEKKAAEEDAQKAVTVIVGHDTHPEVVEAGMMCGDCVERITDFLGGAAGGYEETLTADEPVLCMMNDDGTVETTEKYGTIETGKEYLTKITVHTDGRAFASDLKVCESLQGWHIASVDGNTATLYSPVFNVM